MDAYLLDTTILSVYLDPSHVLHAEKSEAIKALPAAAPKFVSVIALAELSFGVNLAKALAKAHFPELEEILKQARTHTTLEVSNHTAAAYAELKGKLAAKYLAKPLRRDRPKYVEDWVDQASGKSLGVDENDLWMSAQAKERGLIFVTTDKKMKRIEDADSDVRLLVI